MSDDFYEASARKRYQVLEAAKAQSMADLQRFQTDNDEDSAAAELQALAHLNDQQASLERLHRTYQQGKNPVRQARESIITSRRDPANGDEALEIINYGKLPGDPTRLTPEEYNRQQSKFNQLRAAGHIQEKP